MHIPVSVIVPMYNKEKYIEKTLTSILSQSSKPAEIIVVDDCSTDRSVELVREIAVKHSEVRLVIQKENGGVSCARNRGLKEAACEYVTYIDADDFYYNVDKLKNEYGLIKKKEAEGISACVYSMVIRVDSMGRELKVRPPRKADYQQGNILCPLLEWINFATVPRDYIVKKNDLEIAGGYKVGQSQFEDLDLVYRLAKRLQFFCTFEYGTAYRITENGLSAGKNGSLKRNREKVIQSNLSLLDKKTRNRITKRRNIRKKIYKVKVALHNIIQGK